MRDHLSFLKRFFRDPVATGAIAPSSRRLAERMVRDMNLEKADTVVELGPGTGAFTGAISQTKNPDALFVAVELDDHLASDLASRFPQVDVVNESAEHLARILEDRGRDYADAILCGLPWAGFPDDLQQRLMKGVVERLKPGGRFATFAYIHSAWFPAARRYRKMLESNFSKVSTTPVEWLNLPPAFVYRCEK